MIMTVPHTPSHYYNIGSDVISLPSSYVQPLIYSTDPARCTILLKPRYDDKPTDS